MHPTLGHQPRAARSHVWRVRVPRLACSHLHDVWPSNSFQFNEIRPWKIRCFKILDNGEQIIQLKAFVCWTQTCKCRCWNASCLQLSPSFHSHDWNKGTIKNYVETKRKETVTFFSFFWTTSCSSKKCLQWLDMFQFQKCSEGFCCASSWSLWRSMEEVSVNHS